MAVLLGMILFSLNGLISTTVQEHFVNNTEPKCLALSSDKDDQWGGRTIFLRLRSNTTLYVFTSTSIDLPIDLSLQNVSINRKTKEVNFCIPYTTSNYSGSYSMIINTNVLVSATLYVMVKPHAPQVNILSNGTFNKANGILECKAESASLPSGLNITYSWLVNGKIVHEDDKYSFENAFHSKVSVHVSRNENQNIYSCAGTEEHGQTSEKSSGKSIDPLRSPLSTITPNYPVLKEIKDNPLKLICNGSDGNPSHYDYIWFKNGVKLNEEKSETLFIQHLDHINRGNYTCSVNNSVGNDVSTKVLLDVLYGPIASTIKTISQEEGKPVIVHCNVSSNPSIDVNQIMWKRPNNNTFFKKGKDLEILKVQIEDSGIFQCTANLTLVPTVGDEKTKMALANVTLNVLYGPTISLISDYHQIEGRTINISCDVIANPPVENNHIEWTKHGSNYQLSGRNLIEKNVNRSFTGTYECTASVKLNVTVGPPVDKHASKHVSVSVLYAPIIRSIEGNTTYSENDTAEFSCHADSNPKSVIKWKFMDGKKEVSYKVNGGLLKISPMSCLSMGLYTCKADNGISGTQKNLSVSVMCTPRLNKEEHYIKYEVHHVVRENAPLYLTVPILAYPEPWLYWEFQKNHNFTNITSGVTTTHSVNRHTSNLVVPIMTEDGFGQYVIYGVNRINNITYRICSFRVEKARSPETSNRHSSSPSFAAGIGTGLGIAAIIFLITLVITAFIRIKRKKQSAPSNMYAETECKAGPANIYNELDENKKDGQLELIKRRYNKDTSYMYEDVIAYENQKTRSEDLKGQIKGSSPNKIVSDMYMNTEI